MNNYPRLHITFSTPSRVQRKGQVKRPLNESPATIKQQLSKSKIKKSNSRKQETENYEDEITLENIWNLMLEMKESMTDKLQHIEQKVSALEDHIKQEMNEMKAKLTEMVIKEIESQKNKIEDDINKSFKFLEEDIQTKLSDLQSQVRNLQSSNNNLEQYTRKNSVRLFGIPENIEDIETTTLQIFNDKMSTPITREDIEIIHRTGRPFTDKPRPILIKFTSHKKKTDIMRSKKHLKGSKIFITEDLTKENYKKIQELNNIRKSNRIKSVWTIDGKIRIQMNNGQVKFINNQQDINDIP